MPLLVIDEMYKTHPPMAQSQTAQQIQQFSLSKEMERLDQQIQSTKKLFLQSHFYQLFLQYRSTLISQVINPFSSAYRHTYSELPQETTKRKLGILQQFSFDQRFVFLNGLALGSAVLSMRGVNQYNAWMVGVKSLRNTAVTYVLAGLIFAPEIFNPLIKGWERGTLE